ncbi:hypothetical protein ACS0TY_030608 [Phlomoides rotata]
MTLWARGWRISACALLADSLLIKVLISILFGLVWRGFRDLRRGFRSGTLAMVVCTSSFSMCWINNALWKGFHGPLGVTLL